MAGEFTGKYRSSLHFRLPNFLFSFVTKQGPIAFDFRSAGLSGGQRKLLLFELIFQRTASLSYKSRSNLRVI
jgi:hypothetical protein